MALVNFTNLNGGEVITAKHLYIVDKDKELLEVKYEKVREWWKNIIVESVTVMDENQQDISTKINDEQVMKPHVFLNFFRDNHTMSQPKAMYFKDTKGNMIEFTNIIHNNWVQDYVLGEKLKIVGANDIIHYYVTSIVNQVIVVETTDETDIIHHIDKTYNNIEEIPTVNQGFEDNLIYNRNINILLNPTELIPECGLAVSDVVTLERS